MMIPIFKPEGRGGLGGCLPAHGDLPYLASFVAKVAIPRQKGAELGKSHGSQPEFGPSGVDTFVRPPILTIVVPPLWGQVDTPKGGLSPLGLLVQGGGCIDQTPGLVGLPPGPASCADSWGTRESVQLDQPACSQPSQPGLRFLGEGREGELC